MAMDNSTKRHMLRISLMRSWMETQRPAVLKAIEAEIDRQIPRGKRRRTATALPKSLAALK